MPDQYDPSAAAPDSPRRRGNLMRTLSLSFAAVLIGYLVASRGATWLKNRSGAVRDFEVMNTYARVTVPDAGNASESPDELAQLAERAVRVVDTLMSPFGTDSDVRRLNDAPAGVWVEVDLATWTVALEALRWHRLSGGAFDPTIGPIKRLFVFDQSEIDAWPAVETLAEAKSRVGADKLLFEREGMRLAWEKDGMRLDLGAIAKGYSADLAAQALLRRGVANALVDVGGELRVLGVKPGSPATPWKMGIKDPRNPNAILETIELTPMFAAARTDLGVATSGDYERFSIHNGKRYEHIIDPRSGEPLSGGIASATVIFPGSCLAADALATTLCVLGPDGGRELLRSQALGLFSSGVRAILLIPEKDGALRRLEFRVDDKGGFHETESRIAADRNG